MKKVKIYMGENGCVFKREYVETEYDLILIKYWNDGDEYLIVVDPKHENQATGYLLQFIKRKITLEEYIKLVLKKKYLPPYLYIYALKNWYLIVPLPDNFELDSKKFNINGKSLWRFIFS